MTIHFQLMMIFQQDDIYSNNSLITGGKYDMLSWLKVSDVDSDSFLSLGSLDPLIRGLDT